jgi:hypothetical protein
MRNEILEKSEKTVRAENEKLQEKSRQLLDVNKSLSENFGNLKAKLLRVGGEKEELLTELMESRSACDVACVRIFFSNS